ncbi:MAG: VWA domain-containing protein [Planctomycetota bacterium]
MPVRLGALAAGPVQFDRPWWLVLIPALGLAVWWIGRKSLAGLGGPTRWTALAVRLLVIGLLSAALAEPSIRREGNTVAVIVVADNSRSVPQVAQEQLDEYLADASDASRRTGDALGTVTAARDAYVQSLPSPNISEVERQFIGARDGTNLGDAVALAVATARESSANRIVLFSDGNETAGSLLRAAQAARAVDIPIDVLPVEYAYTDEVIVDQLSAPASVRAGETISLRVVMTATSPVRGRLLLTENGSPIDLDPDAPDLGVEVTLRPGKNVFTVPVTPSRPGPQSYEVEFRPQASLAGAPGERAPDSIAENNRSRAVTFVGSEGAVLLIAETIDEVAALERALLSSEINAVTVTADLAPQTLEEMNAYEAIVMLNQSAFNFTERQQELLRQYVHDSGGGLVMVGGPDAFGAGGWIGSPLADALPVRLDPPQKRQMPRGALVIIVHSVEIPQGVFYGKQTAAAAVDALSRLDLVGIIEFSGFGGTDWVYPIGPVGDASAVKRAINGLTFGDMQTFNPSLQLALQGLQAADAGQKHLIIISDGDPSMDIRIVQGFADSGITISTVGVNPHTAQDLNTLRRMANVTGGEFYNVANTALATLPQIFIKEAQTIRRSLIWEGDPFSPAVVGVAAESMRGISGVPPITGYVVTAEREGLSLVTLKAVREDTEDPIAAQWQYGLGKAVAFTGDATTRWSGAWVGWEGYRQFWEQQVRWAMRPGGSATMRVTTETRGDQTLLVIEGFDPAGDRLNFAQFRSRVANPDGTGSDVIVRQVGPGRYEGTIESGDPGSYVVSLQYRAPGQTESGILEGSVQASVVRPFADEFRALESNTGLLRQVASITGGRVLEGDPSRDDLWSREGVTMPVSLSPIWIYAALAGIVLFLADVGVRRVRIDPAAILRSLRRGAGKEKGASGEQLEGLRAVRAKAQQRMTTSGDASNAGSGGASPQAERKFEAGADATGIPLTTAGDEAREPAIKKTKPPAQADSDDGDSLSALRRAKRRAQDEFNDEGN